MKRVMVITVLLASLLVSSVARALPSFPGAQGAGAEAVGGRGGTVYIVDTLSDNPAAGVTFREACQASGRRIVVFAVSGWIDLTSPVEIYNPYLTIAGQTSPGGIGVRGETVLIQASEVVITHFRFAAGSLRGDERDSLRIWGSGSSPATVSNIIIDHCSIRWGCDECGETAYNPGKITLSWSIIGPGLYDCAPEADHNLGFLVWGGRDTQMTFHHNYFAHNRYRNPEVNGGSGGVDAPKVDIVNNVTFDTYGGFTGFHSYAGESVANVVHNWMKKGSQNNTDAREGILFDGNLTSGNGTYYVVGNAGAWRAAWNDTTVGHLDWDALKTDWNGATPHVSWKRTTPTPFPGIPVTTKNITGAYASEIVAGAGASRPVVDSLDATYKSNYGAGIHAFFDGDVTGNDATDYPVFSSPAAPADSDRDGMADSWERANGLTVGANDSAADRNGDGYTNIEEYLFSLGGYATDAPPAIPSNLHIP